MGPVTWADRNETAVAARAPADFGKADREQAASRWQQVQVAHALELHEVGVEEPGLAFQSRQASK